MAGNPIPHDQPVTIRTSSLSYEAYRHADLFGSSRRLWRTKIDGTPFSSTMLPATASDSRVERFACTCCGVQGDGTVFYTVRRLGEFIIWFYEDLLDPETIRSPENLPETFFFNPEEYEQVLKVGRIADIPNLTMFEMRHLVLRYLPPPSQALYAEPNRSDDPRATDLLARVHNAFSKDGELYLAARPKGSVELTMGLDLPGTPECRWQVGMAEGELRALFINYPTLPCWIGGSTIDEAFGAASIAELL